MQMHKTANYDDGKCDCIFYVKQIDDILSKHVKYSDGMNQWMILLCASFCA